MESILLFLVFVMILVIAIISRPIFKLKHKLYLKTGKHPKGHYLYIWLAIGIIIGFFGIYFGNLGLGLALGLILGLVIGSTLEKHHAEELRHFTKEEVKMRERMVIALILGIIVLICLYVLLR